MKIDDGVSRPSKYLGSIVTGKNRNEYRREQKIAFIENQLRIYEVGREKITSQTDKTEEEITQELQAYNADQMTEAEMDELSSAFAKFQCNKEQKHYAAWMKGKAWFRYRGMPYPVMTEEFLRKSQKMKDIIKINQDVSQLLEQTTGEENNEQSGTDVQGINTTGNDESQVALGISAGDEGRVGETL